MNDRLHDQIRVLVVDDERLSRERLRVLLQGEPDVVAVGQCENGLQALDAITALRPELVFLDVQMPDLDGLGVIDAIGASDDCPEIVFVTAYDRYMERAFEVHAVDYLRKPFTDARFASALAHARHRVLAQRFARQAEMIAPAAGPGAVRGAGVSVAPRSAAGLAALAAERDGDPRIAMQDHRTGTWHIVRRDEVDWIETDEARQVCVHLVTPEGKQSFRWRKTLAALEQELAPYGFLRVHRSYLINSERIRQVKALQKGEYALVLADGTMLDTGRTYREVVERFLQHA
jgi:two-component system LytT family response regulator